MHVTLVVTVGKVLVSIAERSGIGWHVANRSAALQQMEIAVPL
jgi:hypothetical protein